MVITTWSEQDASPCEYILPLSGSWSLPSVPSALARWYRDNDLRSNGGEIRSDSESSLKTVGSGFSTSQAVQQLPPLDQLNHKE